MAKNPGFYFYTGDWLKDPGLRICSKTAKGCWIDMLALLSESPFRGVFVTADGKPWSDEQIAGAVGGDTAENLKAIEELLRLGIASRNHGGAIYSRRMVRDQQAKDQDAARKRKQRSNGYGKCPIDVTVNVTPVSEREREQEHPEPKVFYRPKNKASPISEQLLTSVLAIGFRDSTWRSQNLVEHALFQEIEHGAEPDELPAALRKIYSWTNNGEFAPKCHEVISRWREPQNFWERRNGQHASKTADQQRIEDVFAESERRDAQRYSASSQGHA